MVESFAGFSPAYLISRGPAKVAVLLGTVISCRLMAMPGGMMGYFDGLTNGAFKVDDQGRRLFFLYGALGKGRLLPTEGDEIEMRRAFKGFYKYLMFAVMPVVILGNVFLHYSLATYMVLAALMILPAYIWIEVKARRYARVDSRISLGESYAGSARAHSFWMLIVLSVVSFLFVLLGIGLTLVLDGSDRWIGIGGALFFGFCFAVITWMAILNRRQRQG